MERATVWEHLISTIQAVQADAGRECPELTDRIVPLTDLPDFDSLAGVDVEARLSVLLDRELDHIDFKRNGRALTLGEVTDELARMLAGASK